MRETKAVPEIGPSRFPEFFAAVNGGSQPFTWQCELLDFILERGEWPRQIGAPTGAGKSSVVDIHVFANAVAASRGPRVPRRLHTVVNRRALVDNQADRAYALASKLADALDRNCNGILGDVARALVSLRGDSGRLPLEVGHLRGDLPSKTLPLSELSACSVIAATPDMWGSRLLFRGYGSSRNARPREAAFVGMDSVIVIDESHLSRQLVVTARRIAELQCREESLGVPTLQVTETTATVVTPEEDACTIQVKTAALEDRADALLRKRLNATKTLSYVGVEEWNGRPKNAHVIRTIVSEAIRLHGKFGATIGVIVNHVDTATNVAAALRKAGLTALTLVGRMRPWDLEQIRGSHPDAFTIKGDPTVDVVVSTQTLEVGVDVSFKALVTELAPGSSLAQRWGRVNRLGEFAESEVVVVGPSSIQAVSKDAPPYSADDLVAGFEWVERLRQVGSVAPTVLEQYPAPPARLQRKVLQRVERADLDFFARTSDQLVSEPSLELWLRDDLEEDQAMLGMVVRDNLPEEPIPALELLRAFPPRAEEVFPGKIADVRNLLQKQEVLRAFVYRNEEVLLWSEDETPLAPGDVVIVEAGLRFTTENVIDVSPKDSPAKPVTHGEGKDVQVFLPPKRDALKHAKIFADLVDRSPGQAAEILGVSASESEIIVSQSTVPLNGRDVVAWYAIRPLFADESEVMQEWSPSSGKVYLEDHQRDVAKRALDVCQALEVKPDVAAQIERAGLHHDDGKTDERFQRMLGRNSSEPALGKSELRTKQEVKRAHMVSGLPAKWRHEQLSALLYAYENGVKENAELTLRIIGTSHGRGRPGFPHVGSELLETQPGEGLAALANQMFTQGEWDSLIARTHKKYGHFAATFAEAIERAADAQISKEQK